MEERKISRFGGLCNDCILLTSRLIVYLLTIIIPARPQSIMNIKGMKRDEQLKSLHALGVKTGVPSSIGANAAVHKNPDSGSSKGGTRILPAMTLPIPTKTKMLVNSPQRLGGIASNVKSLFRASASKRMYNG